MKKLIRKLIGIPLLVSFPIIIFWEWLFSDDTMWKTIKIHWNSYLEMTSWIEKKD